MNITDFQSHLTIEQQNDLMKRWQEAEANAKYWKDLEMKLRREVDAHIFGPEDNFEAGTMNKPLANGWKLKTERSLNINMNVKQFREIQDQLAPDVRERITKPSLSLQKTEYKRLKEKADNGDQFAAAQLRLIDQAISTSQGAPTVTLVAPPENPNS